MSENIAQRVGRLISGTANMIVDSLEGAAPEMVMTEAIREIDRAIDDMRAELGKVVAKRHMANQRLASENAKHTDLSDKIQIAVNENRQDLAESGVAQLLDIETQIPVIEATITDANEAAAELEGYIGALQARKREMSEELAQFKDAKSLTPDGTADDTGSMVGAGVQRAESAFNRVMENATGMPGMAADSGDARKRAELEKLARENRIRERLASFEAQE